jgi:hypothetical protein
MIAAWELWKIRMTVFERQKPNHACWFLILKVNVYCIQLGSRQTCRPQSPFQKNINILPSIDNMEYNLELSRIIRRLIDVSISKSLLFFNLANLVIC